MKTTKLLLSIITLAAGLSGATAAELFTNGDMGLFTGSVPTAWAVSQGTLTSNQSVTNSPFTNAFGNNNSSWIIDDSSDTTGAAGFYQSFSTLTNYQTISVNFDFKLDTLPNSLWGIQFDGGGASATASSSVHYRIDLAGQFAINAGPGAGAITNILSLSAGTWYNVQATFTTTAINDGSNNGAGFQSGSITPFGGSATTWSDIPLLNTSLGFSRLLVRDRAAGFAGDLSIDNVSVVPEPSTLAMLAPGLMCVLLRRRRMATLTP